MTTYNNRAIGYACTDCYISAHDSSYSPSVEHSDRIASFDLGLEDWSCTVGHYSDDGECHDDGDICTGCDGSGTEYGTTVGGICDLTNHRMSGYWEYHVFLN